jgi:hypothetical protein
MVSSIIYGGLWITTVKSLMYSCRQGVTALQLNTFSKGYCAVMAASPERL